MLIRLSLATCTLCVGSCDTNWNLTPGGVRHICIWHCTWFDTKVQGFGRGGQDFGTGSFFKTLGYLPVSLFQCFQPLLQNAAVSPRPQHCTGRNAGRHNLGPDDSRQLSSFQDHVAAVFWLKLGFRKLCYCILETNRGKVYSGIACRHLWIVFIC